MTEPTPRTEAGRWLLTPEAHVADHLRIPLGPYLSIAEAILAIEAQARTEALDVERLARALAEVWPVSFQGEFATGNAPRRFLTSCAESIAAEYARLSQPRHGAVR